MRPTSEARSGRAAVMSTAKVSVETFGHSACAAPVLFGEPVGEVLAAFVGGVG